MTDPRCRRHDWYSHDTPCYGPEGSGISIPAGAIHCRQCFRVRDETIKRRNRNNRQRGASFERTVAKALGGRRTGPLGGRDDVVGEMFAAQTKKDGRLSLAGARAYLRDLAGTYPTRTPIVVHAEPGDNRSAVVVLWLSDWQALHGPDATDESAA